ncbi:MAG: hypothetical protein ACOCZE_08625, partial [Planctomycetota bacterium]
MSAGKSHLVLAGGLGAVAGMVVLGLVGLARPVTPQTAVTFSDCDGAIEQLVIQYTAESGEISGPIFAQFLPSLPSGATVYVVVPTAGDYRDLLARVGPVSCRIEPVETGHLMTTWSRDRWLAGLGPDGRVWLLSPRHEDRWEIWPARAGDARIAGRIAQAVPAVAYRRSELLFDGGDFVVAESKAFVAERVLIRNIQHTVADRAELISRLSDQLGREVIVLDDAPDHHAGMYIMPAGDGRIFVADPAAGLGLYAEDPAALEALLPAGADRSKKLQAGLDEIAARLTADGWDVLRMPILPGADGRVWLTPLNAILDH